MAATVVSDGSLYVTGSIVGGADAKSGTTLGGTGTIGGATTVESGATLAPGVGSIGTLSFNNGLNLMGATILEIDKSAGGL